MKLLTISFAFMVFNAFSSQGIERVVEVGYLYKNNFGWHEYYSNDSSECKALIRYRDSDSHFDLISGVDCKQSEINQPDLQRVIESASSLLSEKDILNEILKKRRFTINFVWRVSNWPLINFANDSDWWPYNFRDEVKEHDYRRIFEKAILDESVYGFLTKILKSNGCSFNLSKYYADPMNYDQMMIEKKLLLELGYYSKMDFKKYIYPYIEGPILFDLECKKE
ncbi:hypothetical protein [Pseudoalteromonas luteoviolacea]|uniref:Uncharacterized protein n=1 Tax=Pseudoalteromonas luteoviolacea S4054 TaxID=1129367 RepID=A0A0F6AH02_9GAMM|nr:hypothetical protein [Pseudoalteromonas luteoviolacea]AOT12638.1 hypothetical protein S40542_07630 [Pseudoalteromonas luteoviolacea]AOT17552.1 hypothetical protein S4054_07630 [Pseudoalteromonas luteoviolacea]KKE85487.1 hypothetical protein N479_25825 [Pseudoalteromonas luteoviolacea S4054]